MKILIKKKDSAQFLDAKGNWVGNSNEAHDFETAQAAMKKCREVAHGSSVVIFRFSDPQYDTELCVIKAQSPQSLSVIAGRKSSHT